jgi:hypothetical protein
VRGASQTPHTYGLHGTVRLALVLALCAFGSACSLTSITERAVDSNTTAAISPQTVATGDTETVSDEVTVRNAVSSVDPSASLQIPWANADTGSRGAITALIERKENDVLCRSFTTTRESFDGVALYRGKACMDDGGSWQMMAFSPQ